MGSSEAAHRTCRRGDALLITPRGILASVPPFESRQTQVVVVADGEQRGASECP